MKMKVKIFHNHNDFKYGTWKHEHHSDGGLSVFGILKKTGNTAKYMDIYRID